eukprot:GHVP01029357.1.p1 GENE.GHVP01029357.1~~GHVP01029357.1.p1  ORF type:complete len:436 (+),score=94.03 GHVP01029357.1:1250-2557(+)
MKTIVQTIVQTIILNSIKAENVPLDITECSHVSSVSIFREDKIISDEIMIDYGFIRDMGSILSGKIAKKDGRCRLMIKLPDIGHDVWVEMRPANYLVEQIEEANVKNGDSFTIQIVEEEDKAETINIILPKNVKIETNNRSDMIKIIKYTNDKKKEKEVLLLRGNLRDRRVISRKVGVTEGFLNEYQLEWILDMDIYSKAEAEMEMIKLESMSNNDIEEVLKKAGDLMDKVSKVIGSIQESENKDLLKTSGGYERKKKEIETVSNLLKQAKGEESSPKIINFIKKAFRLGVNKRMLMDELFFMSKKQELKSLESLWEEYTEIKETNKGIIENIKNIALKDSMEYFVRKALGGVGESRIKEIGEEIKEKDIEEDDSHSNFFLCWPKDEDLLVKKKVEGNQKNEGKGEEEKTSDKNDEPQNKDLQIGDNNNGNKGGD